MHPAIDGWEDQDRCEVLGFVATDSRRIHKPLLPEYKRVPGRTTHHELLAVFQEVLTVLDGLGVKVLSAIADSASNMKATLKELLQQRGIVYLNCKAHRGELV